VFGVSSSFPADDLAGCWTHGLCVPGWPEWAEERPRTWAPAPPCPVRRNPASGTEDPRSRAGRASRPRGEAGLAAPRQWVVRGTPHGSAEDWTRDTAATLGVESSPRPGDDRRRWKGRTASCPWSAPFASVVPCWCGCLDSISRFVENE
jgi:hypothetical protein